MSPPGISLPTAFLLPHRHFHLISTTIPLSARRSQGPIRITSNLAFALHRHSPAVSSPPSQHSVRYGSASSEYPRFSFPSRVNGTRDEVHVLYSFSSLAFFSSFTFFFSKDGSGCQYFLSDKRGFWKARKQANGGKNTARSGIFQAIVL